MVSVKPLHAYVMYEGCSSTEFWPRRSQQTDQFQKLLGGAVNMGIKYRTMQNTNSDGMQL